MVVLGSLMLHTKFQDQRLIGSGEKTCIRYILECVKWSGPTWQIYDRESSGGSLWNFVTIGLYILAFEDSFEIFPNTCMRDLSRSLKNSLDLTSCAHKSSCAHSDNCTCSHYAKILYSFHELIWSRVFLRYKSTRKQIWHSRKISKDQSKVIIWTLLIVLKYSMLHTKFPSHPTIGSGGGDFKCYHIWAWHLRWSCYLDCLSIFSFP